jgi:hypothetical protein
VHGHGAALFVLIHRSDQCGHINLVLATEIGPRPSPSSVFAIHLLGDALAALSHRPAVRIIHLGQAVKIVPVAVVIGGCVWAWAARAQAQSQGTISPNAPQYL